MVGQGSRRLPSKARECYRGLDGICFRAPGEDGGGLGPLLPGTSKASQAGHPAPKDWRPGDRQMAATVEPLLCSVPPPTCATRVMPLIRSWRLSYTQ